jgi:hypothetical protein
MAKDTMYVDTRVPPDRSLLKLPEKKSIYLIPLKVKREMISDAAQKGA